MARKTIDIRPVTGYMDARSNPEDVALGEYRYVKNVGVVQKSKLCRPSGWDKLLTKTNYNNEDLHDQLLSLTGLSDRLPFTFLFEAVSTRKTTMLLAGTERVIYALNVATGNWKVISDQIGSPGARFKAAQVGDVVVFTNNASQPVYWNFDQGITEANNQSVGTIPDLVALGITKAGTVLSFKSHIFLMNIVEKGTIRGNRILWGNYENALSWMPTADSTAGYFDLDTDETILGALPLGSDILVYTNKGIWEGYAQVTTGVASVFTFVKRYTPDKTGENCLFYPNTLVSIGNEHLYMGSNGIYVYNKFLDKPKLVEWMHKASNLMFDTINSEMCDIHISSYDSENKEVLFSWAKTGETLPSETLVLNTEFPFSYILDHGFSAAVTYTYRSPTATVREWLLEQCICTEEEFGEVFGGFVKEGGFCSVQETITCNTRPVSIFSQIPLELEDGIVTENYDELEADADSLCAQLGNVTLAQLCDAEARADECNSGKRFVVASSIDYTLKEFSQNFYRERTTGFTGCGTYVKEGYKSILRSGPISLSTTDLKEIKNLELELLPSDSVSPGQVKIRIGTSQRALDPNNDNCAIIWENEDPITLKCLSELTPAGHALENTYPDDEFNWPMFYVGKYLYFEIEFSNPNVTPIDTGAAFCMSRITLDVEKVEENLL